MTPTPNEGYVRVERRGTVSHIEFFHPQSNSLPSAVLADLAKAIRDEGHDPAVHVVVLRSGGDRVFCGGASFTELASIRTEAQGLAFFSGFAHVINAIRTVPKFVVGRVHGKAVGGGVGLASAVDYCIATQHAAVKLSELAVGIGPFVVGPAVERKMGLSAMSQLAIDATEFRSASWAQQHGLYAQVVDDAAALDAAVDALAERLAGQSVDATVALKQALWSGTEHWGELLVERAAISGRLVRTEDAQRRIQAILTKL
jgi:methylglutaconyl-CoA hydratase